MAMTTEQTYDALDLEVYRHIHFGYDLRKIREAVASGKISDVDFREWTLKTTCQYSGITISRAERYFITSAVEGYVESFEDLVKYYSGSRLDGIIRNAYIQAKFWREYLSKTNEVRTYIEQNHLELLRFRSDEIGQESTFLFRALERYYNTDVLPEQINLVPLGATLDEACQRVGLTLYEAYMQCGLHPIRSVSLDGLRKRLGIDPETMSTTEQYKLIKASLPQLLAPDEDRYAIKLLNPINPWWLKEQAENAERLRLEQEEHDARMKLIREHSEKIRARRRAEEKERRRVEEEERRRVEKEERRRILEENRRRAEEERRRAQEEKQRRAKQEERRRAYEAQRRRTLEERARARAEQRQREQDEPRLREQEEARAREAQERALASSELFRSLHIATKSDLNAWLIGNHPDHGVNNKVYVTVLTERARLLRA